MIRRLLSLEPAAVGSAFLTVYVAAAMLYRAYVSHDGVLDMDVLVAGVGALYGLYTRVRVTPLAQPRTKEGHPMHGPAAGDQTPPPPRSR